MSIPSRTDDELAAIAMDIHRGLIFTDRHIPPGEMAGAIAFVPLALMKYEDLIQIKDDVGLIYEYLDKASPRSVNGLPSFLSCNILNKADAAKCLEYYRKLKGAVDAALKPVPPADTPTS